MAIRVTKAITKDGHYYAFGDVIDTPTSVEQSLRRLLKWEIISGPEQSISGLRKPQLVQLAEDRGLDVDGLLKADLIELLDN